MQGKTVNVLLKCSMKWLGERSAMTVRRGWRKIQPDRALH